MNPLNSKSSKVCNNYLKESESESSTTLFSTRPQSEKNLQFYTDIFENEIERFNPNFQNNFAPSHIPHQSMIKNESWAPQTSINYGPNNRIYLTSFKNLKTKCPITSGDNSGSKSNEEEAILVTIFMEKLITQ